MANLLEKQPLYLDKEEVYTCLKDEWENVVNEIEKALKSYSANKVIQPVRSAVSIDCHKGFLLVMPAYDSEKDALATKVVTVYPENKKKGLPAVQAIVLLYNAHNGKLKAIIDGEVITNMRTAAASLVASKYLASKSPDYLTILGAGVQARTHFYAFCQYYNFKKIFVWNLNADSGAKFVDEIRKEGYSCELCNTVQEAVKEADIIITVTMASEPILKHDWIKEGVHINAVGAPVPEWQELENKLMLSSIIYVDSKEGALAESGDVIHSKATIYAEIGEVLLGLKEAYKNKTTIFKSLGMAVEDVVTAELVYDKYKERAKNIKA